MAESCPLKTSEEDPEEIQEETASISADINETSGGNSFMRIEWRKKKNEEQHFRLSFVDKKCFHLASAKVNTTAHYGPSWGDDSCLMSPLA